MIKHDYAHMGCPYYEEKLENGLIIFFVPRKSELKSATVYVGQGGFLHAKEILDSKIPFGSAYYLMNQVLSSDFKKELLKEGVLSDCDIDYSFVRYSLNTRKDIYSALESLFVRIDKPCYEEKDIEAFKEKEREKTQKRDSNAILLSQERCLKNLYLSSPIRFGCIPSYQDSVRIHASALKKYQETYYTSDKIVLFLSFDAKPEEVFSTIKKMKLTSPSLIKENKWKYEEDYNKVKEEYEEVSGNGDASYLTYGIKFPGRSIIYDSYGELPFVAYEILLDSIVSSNSAFQDSLRDIRANLIDSQLKEGGEDTYLLLTFQTEDSTSLISFLTDYFSKLDARVSQKDFNALQKKVFTSAIKKITMPNEVCDQFSRSYPNHLPYLYLMNRVSRLNFNSYHRFLMELKGFKKSVCFVKKRGGL